MNELAQKTDVGLVPRARFGALLARRREQLGLMVEDVCRFSGDRYSSGQIARMELGDFHFEDADLERLTLLYEISATPAMRKRSKLVLDETEATIMRLGGVENMTPNELLIRYLAFVYIQRGAPVGEIMPMRSNDIESLSELLGTEPAAMAAHLDELMDTEPAEIDELASRFRTRVIIPTAGVVIGLLEAGAVVLTLDY